MSIWTVTERDIYTLRGAAGELFTTFCDSLLRVECLRAGIPFAQLSTNQRTVKKDGGVDTRLDGVSENGHGLLTEKTIWQYKAIASGDLRPKDLEEEVKKPYAAELIREGYAYRLAICDDVPDQTRHGWEAALATYINAINPGAPQPRVVTAGLLAAWASEFPAIRVMFVGSQLYSVLHIETWGRNITDKVKRFVVLNGRGTTTAALAAHVDMTRTPERADFIVEGEPGIGKTRLVYETLVGANAKDLVVYTNDDHIAVEMAASLANAKSVAVLVVDDCPLPARLQIAEVLAGSRDRVRVITIQSPEQRHHLRSDEMWLSKMSDGDIDAILDANFEEVATDRRRSYRELSTGYIRLAIELCRNDALIVARGRSAALADIAEYLQVRLTDEQMIAIEVVALFQRIGFRGELAEEFGSVVALLSIDGQAVRNTISLMKDAPGFVAEGGRYYYVTPTVVADVAFHLAWRRWVHGDPNHFLSQIAKLPPAALESFMRRVSISANSEVRRSVGEFFRDLIVETPPELLGDGPVARLLCTLVEAEPEANLPLLTALVQRASAEDLRVERKPERGWSGRRYLVWLCERLAQFPEYFDFAEAILWELARNENEPGIGNNATAQWQQLFRVLLSGTASPLDERLVLLGKRVHAAHGEDLMLAVGAVGQIFNAYPSRNVGLVYAAGRPAPEEWRPRTYGDIHAAQRWALRLLQGQLNGDQVARDTVIRLVTDSIWTILYGGLLKDLAEFLDTAQLSAAQLLEFVSSVREFAKRNADTDDGNMKELVASVREWTGRVTKTFSHGRLLTLLSTERDFEVGNRDERWPAEAAAVAGEIVQDGYIANKVFELVNCSNPGRSFALGREIGQRDSRGEFLNEISSNAVESSATAFAAGYVTGLASTGPAQLAAINILIDRLEGVAPTVAFELARSLGADAHHLKRTITQVRNGRFSIRYVRTLMFGVSAERLTRDELLLLMEVLLAARDEVEEATTVALELLGYYIGEAPADGPALGEPRILEAAWHFTERVENVRQAYVWADVARALAESNVGRVIDIGMSALAHGGFDLRMYAEPLIAEIAQQRPREVIDVLLHALSGEGLSVGLLVGTVRKLVATFPSDVARAALKAAPLGSVRRFARHLSPPTLVDGTPVVPDLTLLVLTEFEDDDEVFESFYFGTHAFRTYMGDIAAQHDLEAAVAGRFLTHPAKRLREWAAREIAHGKSQAKYWRDLDAEQTSEQ